MTAKYKQKHSSDIEMRPGYALPKAQHHQQEKNLLHRNGYKSLGTMWLWH